MLNENAYAVNGAIARCDRAVMKAWLEHRYPTDEYEPWPDFQARVQAGLAALRKHSPQETIGVFTSATPIAIAAGVALQGTNKKALEMAWVMYNSGVTTMKLRAETFHLYTLNAAPHLPADDLRTFR
jgi:broad specificity phosphatase PhoE